MKRKMRSRTKEREEKWGETKRRFTKNGDEEKKIRKHEIQKKSERETLRWRNKERMEKREKRKRRENQKEMNKKMKGKSDRGKKWWKKKGKMLEETVKQKEDWTKTKNGRFFGWVFLWFKVKREKGFNLRFIFVLLLTFCYVCLLRFAPSPCHPCPLDAHCDWYRPRRRSTRFGNLHLTFLWTRRVCKRIEKERKKKDDQTKQGLQKQRYIKRWATEKKTFKNEN